MSLGDSFISKLAPHDCLGCGYEGSLLCRACSRRGLSVVPERCYRCRRLSAAARTCYSCRRTSRLDRVRVALVYEELAKALVWHLKFGGAQAAASEMAKLMLPILPEAGRAVIVPVPTSTKRARGRGYDQAKLLARALARQARVPYADCLKRLGQTKQVGATRHERLRQLSEAFWASKPRRVGGHDVILVDDVVTTGATLEAAAAVLKLSGAKRVSAVVFAQP